MGLIFISHNLTVVSSFCDRVLIINQGRVVAEGTPAALRREIFGRSTYELEVAGDAGQIGRAHV